jgi:hypothetical protein
MPLLSPERHMRWLHVFEPLMVITGIVYGVLNRKAAIYVGNIIGLAMNLLMVNGVLMNAGWTY